MAKLRKLRKRVRRFEKLIHDREAVQRLLVQYGESLAAEIHHRARVLGAGKTSEVLDVATRLVEQTELFLSQDSRTEFLRILNDECVRAVAQAANPRLMPTSYLSWFGVVSRAKPG